MTTSGIDSVVKPAVDKVSKKPPAIKPAHPSTSEMVNAAISTLNEKKGSSLQAIKKYIATHYTIDVDKQSSFIKRYLKSAIEKKIIITKGSGLTGRFKLSEKPTVEKKKIIKKVEGEKKQPAAEKKVKIVTEGKVKKSTTEKKSATKAKAATTEKKTVTKKAKSAVQSKAKKSGKAPTNLTKSPKPKKATSKKVA